MHLRQKNWYVSAWFDVPHLKISSGMDMYQAKLMGYI